MTRRTFIGVLLAYPLSGLAEEATKKDKKKPKPAPAPPPKDPRPGDTRTAKRGDDHGG